MCLRFSEQYNLTFGSRLASLLLRAQALFLHDGIAYIQILLGPAGKVSALPLITPLLVVKRISAHVIISLKTRSPSWAEKPRPGMYEMTAGHKQAPSCVRLLKGAIA